MNLSDVKTALNIDFEDQDQYLTSLMNSAFEKAKSIMGENIDIQSVQEDMPEVYNAILEDIAVMYQNRGEKDSGSETSIKTYRRNSVSPMI